MKHSPRDSEYFRLIYGEQALWGSVEHLLATQVDLLNLILWLTGDSKKNPKPKPLPRPGVEEEGKTTIGSKESAVPVDEFWEIWNAEFPQEED